MITLFYNPTNTIILEYDNEYHFFMQTSKGKVSHEDYKAVNEALFKYIGEYDCRKILYNIREVTGTEIISRGWYVTIYLPKLYKKYGTEFYCAIVKSKIYFENMSAEIIYNAAIKLGVKGKIEFFDDIQKAMLWTKMTKRIKFDY